MRATLARFAWFVAVGGTAAAVHFAVVVALVEAAGWAPLAANVAGWGVAFIVSFSGQRLLTFRARATPWLRALPRFFLVSAAGFLVNEISYAVLLHVSALRYDLLLAGVLLGVAVMTYLLSSRWAFRGSSPA